ncbi:PRC-barrel domain-containing protein [Rhodopila sp.]|uniref:PRC-barrel domain-containing protein n=1 Tax=Rhodopila sp. TaxID=2480087 RepID=UPI003D0D2157
MATLAAAAPALAQPAPGTPSHPKLTVASVRLDNGYRASKIIGAAVYNDQNQQVGDVSDLFLSKQNQVAMAVISVGGFLGIGAKLVSVPIDKLQIDGKNKVIMAGATKDELNHMPNTQFSN